MDLNQQPEPNMHISWPNGDDSIVSAQGGFIRRHGGEVLDPPVGKYLPKMRPVIKDFIRKARGRTPRGPRLLGLLPLISMVTGEIAAEAQLAGRKPKDRKRLACEAARIEGHPDFVETTMGPVPAGAAGCQPWPMSNTTT